MRLSDYLTDTQALLRDNGYYFNSKPQTIRWINEARRLLSMKTGCIQRIISGQSAFGGMDQAGFSIPGANQPGAVPEAFNNGTAGPAAGGFFISGGAAANPVFGASLGPMMTSPGVERYPYVGFFNNYLKQQHKGCDKVNDAISLAVSWGGVTKPTLDWMPWDEFQAYCRSYNILTTAYPSVWSTFNDGSLGEVWMFPVPSQANPMDLQATCLPSSLYSDDDFEAIPETFTDVIKFGAAALGFMSTYRWNTAAVMSEMGGGYVPIQRASADRGKTRSYYPTFP